ncbi:MAG: ABC transporter permease [Pseudochelatococcus sp.]|jgi:peptide/nickel transport system permease protein|uniref:ABC transporter permease n=1 Tax=Pseudochelatococcus sp. TaxID=2020869 RepID=UPI003D8D2DDE
MTDLLLGREAETDGPARAGRLRIGRFRFQPVLLLSVLVLATVLSWAIAPELFTSRDPIRGIPRDALLPPSAEYWFGTDHLGRDIFTRTVYGSAITLQATALAVLIAFVVGGAVGVTAGFLGGRVDAVLMRLTDVLMAIPSLLLSMAIVTVLGFSIVNIAIAVGMSSVATFARLTRGEVLRWRVSLFVEAAETCGVSRLGVVWHHILPHALGPILALAALEFGAAVLDIAALSFLGFGTPPPQPEWGLLIAEGRNFIAVAWWYTTLPGLVVVASVLAANRVARHLQDRGGRA